MFPSLDISASSGRLSRRLSMTARPRNRQGRGRHRSFGLMQFRVAAKSMAEPLVQRASGFDLPEPVKPPVRCRPSGRESRGPRPRSPPVIRSQSLQRFSATSLKAARAASRAFLPCCEGFHRPVPGAWSVCSGGVRSMPQRYRKWSISERCRICWRRKARRDNRFHRDIRDDAALHQGSPGKWPAFPFSTSNPAAGWVSISARSWASRRPGLSRTASGILALPMS